MSINQFYTITLQDFIKYENGLAIYQNKPFTGIVIEHKNSVVVNKWKYKQGVKTSEERQFFPITPDVELINVNNIIERGDNDATIYNDMPLSGIIYYFIEDYCYYIQEYESGWENSDLGLSPSGKLSHLYRNSTSYSERLKWENDQLRSYEVCISIPNTRLCSVLSLSFSSSNRLIRLSIENDFYSVSETVKDDLWYPNYLTFEDLLHCQIADSLMLSEDNAEGDFFKQLIDSEVITLCSELILPNNSISPKILEKYLPLSSIQKLIFRDMSASKISKASYQHHLSNYALTFID